MDFIIETGAGVRRANAYISAEYADSYLNDRGRDNENGWNSRSKTNKKQAIVAATDYLEKKYTGRFRGQQKFTFKSVSAKATLTFSGLPRDGETITIGGSDCVYTFVTSLSGDPFEVLIGSTANNLATAINSQNPYARASSPSQAIVKLTALAPGASGDMTILTGSATNLTIAEFSGGLDGGAQTLSWPRNYVYDESGTLIEGVPNRLKQAVCEYAVRAVSENLLPDPTVDRSLQRRLEKVGPIEEEYEYVPGTAGKVMFRSYPAADKLLSPLLLGFGGVIRG